MRLLFQWINYSFQKQLEKEAQDDQRYRKQLEQERRDHELAMRLAEETNGQIDESPTFVRKWVEISSFFLKCE